MVFVEWIVASFVSVTSQMVEEFIHSYDVMGFCFYGRFGSLGGTCGSDVYADGVEPVVWGKSFDHEFVVHSSFLYVALSSILSVRCRISIVICSSCLYSVFLFSDLPLPTDRESFGTMDMGYDVCFYRGPVRNSSFGDVLFFQLFCLFLDDQFGSCDMGARHYLWSCVDGSACPLGQVAMLCDKFTEWSGIRIEPNGGMDKWIALCYVFVVCCNPWRNLVVLCDACSMVDVLEDPKEEVDDNRIGDLCLFVESSSVHSH